MTPTEFLQDRNIVAEDKTDLIIGFDNGTKESLIELLDSYHQAKLKLLSLHSVSNHRELLIAYEIKMRCCTDEQAEQIVDSYLAVKNFCN